MEDNFDNQLETFDGMLRERGIGDISQSTGVGRVLWILDGAVVDGEPCGREFQIEADSMTRVRDACKRLYEHFDATDDVRAMLADGELIDRAYGRMNAVRDGLRRAYLLADELMAPPVSSYCVVKRVVTEEWASFEGPAGMDPEEAERWFEENVDDGELNWMGGDVVDSSIESVAEEE